MRIIHLFSGYLIHRLEIITTIIFLFGFSGIFPVLPQNTRKCTIRQLIGTVKIRRGISADWTDAKLKTVLKESDAIRTFIESEAELEIDDGSVLKVSENTTLEIGMLRGKKDRNNTSVKIMNGEVLANIKKLVSPASSFEFETPTATAAIRGTIIGLVVGSDQTTVKVYEGKVLVTPAGSKKTTEMREGHMGLITKGTDEVKITKLEEKTPSVSVSIVKTETGPSSDSLKATTIRDSSGSATDTSHKKTDTIKTITDTSSQSLRSRTLNFTVSTPSEGQLLTKPIIQVSGTVTPGAEVSVMSMRLPVASSGIFSGQVPIADEAGELTVEFEASLGGATQKIIRRVAYKPEYRFVLTSPVERQTFSTTDIFIKGEVVPANAEITVLGKRLSVNSNGQFMGNISIPDEEGEITLDFEISAGGMSRTETRRIIYKKPPDTYRPQVSASVSKGCWNVTVFDRTVDEEITLWYEIDGNREFRILHPNEYFCIPLENGIHSYRLYAEDRAKNRSQIEVLNNYPYLSTNTWYIKLRKPSGNVSIDIPPSSPAGEVPFYPIEFTIENLPQDNILLIREVNVTNKTNGKRVSIKNFTDNFIETEIELVRGSLNQIQIDVNDINNVIKNKIFQINVQ